MLEKILYVFLLQFMKFQNQLSDTLMIADMCAYLNITESAVKNSFSNKSNFTQNYNVFKKQIRQIKDQIH